MTNPKFKIGVFTFSHAAAEAIKESTYTQMDDIELQLFQHGLEDAVPIAMTIEKQGVEVVLSRRGTATLIRENLKIPVITFPVSSIDILVALQEASKFGKTILFTTFRKKLPGLEVVEKLLNINLIQGVYYDTKSMHDAFSQANKQGCQIAVGGGVTKSFGKKHQFKVIELQTPEEEIYSTLENAKSVAKSNREERERAQSYYQVLDTLSEGVVAADKSGEIFILNKAARDALKESVNSNLYENSIKKLPFKYFEKIFKNNKILLNRIESLESKKYMVNYFPILIDSNIIGAVSTFKNIENVVEAEKIVRELWSKGLMARYHIDNMLHKCPLMQEVVTKAKQFARTNSTILITGETGTGKEILAQSIHNLSQRAKKPFVSINCASLPEQLIESELFGYEQGAFTGAQKGGKPGLFELAHTGSIFLDEISSTSETVQTSLLRVIEQKQVRRIGGERLISVDLRIISATNTDLANDVATGSFRSDLFYRLNVLKITIPPLRERYTDIPLLVEHFIQKISAQHESTPFCIPSSCLKILMQYSWPGNVRQLYNFVEQLVLLCGHQFKPEIFEKLIKDQVTHKEPQKNTQAFENPTILKDQSLEAIRDYESQKMWQVLVEAKFSKKRAAELLGISRTTLWRRLKKANILV